MNIDDPRRPAEFVRDVEGRDRRSRARVPRDDTATVRAARNAYAAALLLVVAGAYASAWLLPRYGVSGGVGTVALMAAASGAVLAATPVARPLRHLSTFFHELAHCVAAVAVGASPRRITYRPDATGLAVLEFPGRVGRWRRSLVLLAGYLGPAVTAGALTAGIAAGRSRETLVVLAGCAAGALVLLVRNAWGAFVAAVVGILCWIGARSVPAGLIEAVPAFLAGALAVLGVRDAGEQYRLRDPGECDAAGIAAELPPLSWRGVAAGQLVAAGIAAGGVACLLLVAR